MKYTISKDRIYNAFYDFGIRKNSNCCKENPFKKFISINGLYGFNDNIKRLSNWLLPAFLDIDAIEHDADLDINDGEYYYVTEVLKYIFGSINTPIQSTRKLHYNDVILEEWHGSITECFSLIILKVDENSKICHKFKDIILDIPDWHIMEDSSKVRNIALKKLNGELK